MTKLIFIFPTLIFFINYSYANQALGKIEYDERGLPLINILIDNQPHKAMLDTGSSQGLHLYKKSLLKIIKNKNYNAKKEKPLKTSDLAGNIKVVPAWTLQNLKISEAIFSNVKIVGFKPWGLSIGGKLPDSEVVGLGLFDKHIIHMDFKNHFLKLLSGLPNNINSWAAFSLQKSSSGLIVKASTGEHNLSLILDTGASHSFIFSDTLPQKTKLYGCNRIDPQASKKDCDTAQLVLIDSNGKRETEFAIVIEPPAFEDFDGVLGMKFLQGHETILDLSTNTLYINR